jgi:hypothetical protein
MKPPSDDASLTTQPATWLTACAALVGIAASRTTVGKIALLAAAGTTAYRLWGKNRGPQPVQPARLHDAEVFVPLFEPEPPVYLPPASFEPIETHLVEKEMPPAAHQPVEEAPISEIIAEVSPPEPEITPEAPSLAVAEEVPAPVTAPEPILSETPPPRPASKPLEASPGWVLALDPLPQIVDHATRPTNTSLVPDVFGKVDEPTLPKLPSVTLNNVEPPPSSKSLPPFELPAKGIESAPEPVMQPAAIQPTPFLASADVAKLLQNLAERLPPTRTIDPLVVPSLRDLRAEAPTVIQSAEELSPLAKVIQTLSPTSDAAPASAAPPADVVIPTPASQPEAVTVDAVSAVSLFSKLASAVETETPTGEATNDPLQSSPLPPRTRQRPMITVGKNSPSDQSRKNWLTWWK